MATVVRKQRLVNPARRSARRRNLSPKQIKYFGSPAQKAALKRKRNSAQRKPSAKPSVRRRARHVNPGEIITFGLAGLAGNPAGRKRSQSTMKKNTSSHRPRRRNRTRNRARNHARRAALRNPSMPAPRRRRRHNAAHHTRRRRNPGEIAGMSNLLVEGAWVGAGAIGTRFLTQIALSSKNTGVFGYLANAGVALALGFAGKKFVGKRQGDMITLGGFTALALRIFQDYTPFGAALNSQLSGVGDLGVYGATTFFVPLAEAPGNNRGAVALPAAVIPPPPPAPAPAHGASGVGRYGASGRYSR